MIKIYGGKLECQHPEKDHCTGCMDCFHKDIFNMNHICICYPQDMPWYPYIEIEDCPRISTCKNCSIKKCPVVEKAKTRLKQKKRREM